MIVPSSSASHVLPILFFLCFLAPLPAPLAGQSPDPESRRTVESAAPRKSPTPAPKKQVRYIMVNKLRYVNLADLAAFYGRNFAFTNTGVLLSGSGTKIELTTDKRTASFNNVVIHLLHPMLVQNNRAYLSELDYKKVFDPLLRNATVKKHRLKTIMIDPGHGGSDPGAAGPLFPEKIVNLQIAQKLKSALTGLGFKVIMTRNGDTFPSLSARTDLSAKMKPDIFLSIHCNASTTKSVKGFETYLLTPTGGPPTGDTKSRTDITSANGFDNNNYRLAYEIQRSAIGALETDDRGVRHANFYVLRNASCPAVLIECGFLSNASEGKKISTKETQNLIVTAILAGLARYAVAIR